MRRIHGEFLEELLQRGYLILGLPVVSTPKGTPIAVKIAGEAYLTTAGILKCAKTGARIWYWEPSTEKVVVAAAGGVMHSFWRTEDGKIEYHRGEEFMFCSSQKEYSDWEDEVVRIEDLFEDYRIFLRRWINERPLFDHMELHEYLIRGGLIELLPNEFTFSPKITAYYFSRHSTPGELSDIMKLIFEKKAGYSWWEELLTALTVEVM